MIKGWLAQLVLTNIPASAILSSWKFFSKGTRSVTGWAIGGINLSFMVVVMKPYGVLRYPTWGAEAQAEGSLWAGNEECLLQGASERQDPCGLEHKVSLLPCNSDEYCNKPRSLGRHWDRHQENTEGSPMSLGFTNLSWLSHSVRRLVNKFN